MLASKRQELILERIDKFGQVNVTALSDEWQISVETVRRDINFLHQKKQLRKVHGGAVGIKQNRFEETYSIRAEENTAEKKLIGAYCSEFIEDNDVIGLATGATTDWICRFLPCRKSLTVITSSISAVNILCERKQRGEITADIVFLGGTVNIGGNYCEGPLTTEILGRFSIDKCFIAATAVSENGIKMHNIFDGEYSKELINRSSIIYYLGASEKMGREALYKVCGLERLHHFITDDRFPMSSGLSAALNRANTKCHILKSGEANE